MLITGRFPRFLYIVNYACLTILQGVEDLKVIEVMNKTITGRIGKTVIFETIQNYQPNIPEQEKTAKNNILRKFEDQGCDPNEVAFD